MFVPTIKYRRVNDPQDLEESIKNLDLNDTPPLTKMVVPPVSSTQEAKVTAPLRSNKAAQEENPPKKTSPKESEKVEDRQKTQEPKKEEKKEATDTEAIIQVDPSDEDRIVVTLSDGKKYIADRYCPHAGADLSYLGEVAEDEYPPEIGPVLLCTLHYWEFALEKGGRSGGGWASLNACPASECPAKDTKLEW